MTKQEILEGASALNGDDKNYTVRVEGDKIILSAETARGRFTYVAHLNDDNTYVETHSSVSPGSGYGGRSASAAASISLSLNREKGRIEIEKEAFNSKRCKRLIRDYLEECGYKRTNRGLFRRLFNKK